MNNEISMDPAHMPVCPLCDNGMVYGEDEVMIVFSSEGKALGLAHVSCVQEHHAENSQFGVGA